MNTRAEGAVVTYYDLVLSFVEREPTLEIDIAEATGLSPGRAHAILKRWQQLGKVRLWLHRWDNGKRSWLCERLA